MPFVKGQTGWNKGLTKETDKRLDYARPTCFKKGQPSWNKGTKGIMTPINGYGGKSLSHDRGISCKR